MNKRRSRSHVKLWLEAFLRRWLARLGIRVSRLSADERLYAGPSYDKHSPVPESAYEVLRLDNPRLQELRQAYRALNLPVCRHTIWDERELAKELTLPWFRGDNAYVWQFRQVRSEIRLKQYLVLKYVEERDDLKLLEKLQEDGAFGCWTFRFGARNPVSRDLLESVNEINFLHRHLSIADIPDLTVLDIGAGYGRLAHRMCSALPNVARYDCVDAVPESTFICDYYLGYRGVDDRANSIPLHEISSLARTGAYHVAVNIYSFSECTLESVRWWLEKVKDLKIPYLLIVPNHPDKFLTCEADGDKVEFLSDIDEFGFDLVHKEPIYNNPELYDLIGVKDQFFLFKQRGV